MTFQVLRIPENGMIQQFYEQATHESFDVLHFDFSNQDAIDELEWEGLNKEKVIPQLMKHQRLLRLYPEGEIAKALLEQNFGSAHEIAELPEQEFVERCNKIDSSTALDIYKRAVDIRERTALLSANLREVVASPHYRTSRFSNLEEDLIQFAEDNTELESITIDPGEVMTDERKSIFSPEKYFMDLRKLIDEQISWPREPSQKLSSRRPDLYTTQIPFDHHYGNTEIPYLQHVNEIVEARLIKDEIPEVDFHLAAIAKYPFNLPFHLPLTQIRTYLQHFELDLATILEQFLPTGNEFIIAREQLALSHEEFELIKNPNDDEAKLKEYFGIDDLDELKKVTTFLKQADMIRSELQELLYQQLSKEEQEHSELFKLFFINQDVDGDNFLEIRTEGTGKNKIEIIEHLNNKTLDRIHRFIRLAKKLQWSFIDLDWVINRVQPGDAAISETTIVKIAQIKLLQKRFNLPLDELLAFWHDMKTYGRKDDHHPEDLFDRIFNAPMVFDSTKATAYRPKYDENPSFTDDHLVWNPEHRAGIDAQHRQRLIAALCIDDANLSLLTDHCFAVSVPELQLTVSNMTLLYRYSKLALVLKLPIDQFLSLINLLKAEEIITEPFKIKDLVAIAKWRDWLKNAGLSVYQLEYLTTGITTPFVNPGYTIKEAERMIQKLPASPDIKDPGFVTSGIDEELSKKIVENLKGANFINEQGWVIIDDEKITYEGVKEAIADLLPERPISVLNFPKTEPIYIDCGKMHKFGLTDAVTIETWIKSDGDDFDGMIVYNGAFWDTNGFGIYWSKSDGNKIWVRLQSKDSNDAVSLGFEIESIKNTWTHLAFSWSKGSGKLRLFVNGKQAQEADFNSRIGLSKYPLTIGGSQEPNRSQFAGQIADVRIWNHARTEKEIEQYKNARLIGNETGLVGYYPIDDGQGELVSDKSATEPANGTIKKITAKSETGDNWQVINDSPMDSRIVHVRDTLIAYRVKLELIPELVLIDLTEFFSSKEDMMNAAISFANGTPNPVDHLYLLIAAKDSEENLIKALEWIANLAHKLYVSKTFGLTAEALLGIHKDYNEAFGLPDVIDDNFDFSLEQLENLQFYRKLSASFRKIEKGLLGVFAQKEPAAQLKQLAKISGWHLSELESAVEKLDLVNTHLTVPIVQQLSEIFQVIQSVGINIESLHHLSTLHESSGTIPADKNWLAYKKGALNLLKIVNAKYEGSQWENIISPINDDLNESIRDAQSNYCGFRLGLEERLEDLYEHLLIDVEMSGCARISRLKQALNALQLYVHRCSAGLEEDVVNNISEADWKRMGQYRVWEAHEKLEAYPENFIDPNLRKLKTPIYDEIQTEILQGDLNEEAAETAYRNYFEKFAEQANLKPIDACYATVNNPETGKEEKTLFIIGRARNAPHTFYTRRAIIDTNSIYENVITEWTPWEKLEMGASIQSETITPVFAFGKWFLFWVELSEITKTRMEDGKSIATKGSFAHIQYIYQDVRGIWSAPQTLVKDVLVRIESEDGDREIANLFPGYMVDRPSITVKYFKTWMKSVDLNEPWWKKVYPLFMPTQLAKEQLIILYGAGSEDPEDNHDVSYNINIAIQPIRLNTDLSVDRVAVICRSKEDSVSVRTSIKENKLCLRKPRNVFVDNWHNRVILSGDTDQTALDQISPRSSEIPVKNVLGWTIFDNGDEFFLTFPKTQIPLELSRNSKSKFDASTNVVDIRITEVDNLTEFVFTRLSSYPIQALTARLLSGGLPNLLNLDAQQLPELDFNRFKPNSLVVTSIPPTHLDFSLSYGAYFWEIFFDIPFLLAKSLNEKKRFEESRKWFNYIFNPNNPQDSPFSWKPERFQKEPDFQFLWSFDGALTDIIRQKPATLEGAQLLEVNDFPGTESRNVISPGAGKVNLGKEVLSQSDPFYFGFTVEFWLKIEDDFIGVQNIFGQDFPSHYTPMSIEIEGEMIDTEYSYQFSFGVWGFEVKAKSANFSIGKWHHYAFTWSNIGLDLRTIYLDGIEQKGEQVSSNHSAPILDEEFYLFDGENNKLEAQIADLGIWSHSLHTSEIEYRAKQARAGYWQFLPLRAITLKKIVDNLSNPVYLFASLKHKQDAEAKARLQPCSLQKAIVMYYIDNLLDWGDAEFSKDSWENNVLATMLYVQAGDILGRQPRYLQSSNTRRLLAAAIPHQKAGEQLMKMEQFIVPVADNCKLGNRFSETNDPHFYTPENEVLVNYWSLVADRLFKLRHCMNIEGVTRLLASYQLPIDPQKLAEQLAGGESNLTLPGEGAVNRTKFPKYMTRAIRATRQVMRLGQSLLKAIESMDAADMDSLVSEHEKQLLGLTTYVKEQEVKEQQEVIRALEFGKKRMEAELDYNSKMLAGEDGTGLDLASLASSGLSVVSRILSLPPIAAAIPVNMIPTVYGLASGKVEAGSATEAMSDFFAGIADTTDTVAAMLTYTAEIVRRKFELSAQAAFCNLDIAQIRTELTGADMRLSIIKKEKEIHEKTILQSQEKDLLEEGQFTGPDHYRWMVQRLSSIYLQAYKVAYDLAKAAEKTYQSERSLKNSFIKNTHWDSVKKGLLAAEGLLVDLEQLDKAYLDSEPKNLLNLNKTIRLSSLDPGALLELKEEGRCTFQLTESLFDHDFPGHYNRKIKSVALSVGGSFETVDSVRASLKQLNNRIVCQPDLETAKFLLWEPKTRQPTPNSLQTDYIASQQIAVTHCEKDCGLFELKFDDDHYLPFEGTGAISTWELRMPKAANRFSFEEIEDISLHLQYTALDAGVEFASELVKTRELKYHAGHRNVSIRQEFPEIWEQFLAGGKNGKHELNLKISEKFFNINLKPDTFQLGKEEDEERNIFLTPIFNCTVDQSITDNLQMTVNEDKWNKKDRKVKVGDASKMNVGKKSEIYPIHLTLSKPPEQLMVDKKIASAINPEKLTDIFMILPFEGELNWSGLVH